MVAVVRTSPVNVPEALHARLKSGVDKVIIKSM